MSIDNADKEIFPLVDHFIAKERAQESEIDCETLLETIVDTESEVTELNYRIQDLMLDYNELSEYLKNSTPFNIKLKKSKRKLQSRQYRLKLGEMRDEMKELTYQKLC